MVINRIKKIFSEILIFEFNFKSLKLQFFENFALMYASGIPISQVLKIQLEEIQSKKLKRTITQIAEEINAGSSIFNSFKKHKIVPVYLLNLLKVGEESGNLNRYLQVGLDNIQKEREFKSQIRSASLYPMFVLVVLFAVTLLIFTFVIPGLSGIYESFEIDLPLTTRVVISIGEFMQNYGIIVIPGSIAFILVSIHTLFIRKKTRFIGQAIMLRIPVIGKLLKRTEIARFAYFMGTLLETGFPVIDSFEMLIGSTNLVRYEKFYKDLRFDIESGYSFEDVFVTRKEARKLIEAYPRQLIISGEESGNLAKSFMKVADSYAKLSESSSKNFGVLFEPVLLTIVWVGVAGIALAIISPIYSLVGNFSDISSGTPGGAATTEDNESSQVTDQTSLASNSKIAKIKTIQAGNREIPIYASPNGDKAGSAKENWVYELKEIQDSWYQVVLEDGSTGWLEEIYVQEI